MDSLSSNPDEDVFRQWNSSRLVDNPKKRLFSFFEMGGPEKAVLPTSPTAPLALGDDGKTEDQTLRMFNAARVGAYGGLFLWSYLLFFKKGLQCQGERELLVRLTLLKRVEAGQVSALPKLWFWSPVSNRMFKRALVGGFAYDFCIRRIEMESGRKRWLNSVLAVLILGGLAGVRGGGHTAMPVLAGFSFGLGALIHQTYWFLCTDDGEDKKGRL